MLSTTDFLALNWREADAYLLERRKLVNASLPDSRQIGQDDVTLLVVMDGVASHKQHHPSFFPFHYSEFSDVCRGFMKSSNGKVLSADLDGHVECLICGWFPSDGVAAATAATKIREHFRESALSYRGPWVHERHSVAAIGRSEYAAYRLLQKSSRDRTTVDPHIWDKFTNDMQNLLLALGFNTPDSDASSLEIERAVASNINVAKKAYLQLQAKAKEALEQSAMVTTSLAD